MTQATAAPSRSCHRWPTHFWPAIATITVFGGLLRGLFIGRQPLWRDEAFTALAVQHPTGAMLDIVSRDSAPPLAYLASHLMASTVSGQPWALRGVSLLAGIIVIPLAAALGRRVNGDSGGVWSAIACALLPTLVVSARDARMYATAAMLVAAATLALLRFCDQQTWRRWLIYMLLVALGVQTEYFVVPAVAALFVGAIVAYRPRPGTVLAVVIANLLAAALLVPWLLTATAQFHHSATPFWVEPLGVKTVFGTYVQFFSGTPVDPGTPLKLFLQTFQAGAIAVGTAALGVFWLRRQRLSDQQRSTALYLAIGGAGGTVLLGLASLWRPLLEARYASVGWVPAMVLIGSGISLVDRQLLRGAACAGLAAASLALSISVVHPDTQPVVEYLDSHLNGGAIAAAPSQYLLLRYYGDANVRVNTHVVADSVPWFWGTAVYPNGAVVHSWPGTRLGAPLFSVDDFGDPPTAPPSGYRRSALWCVTGTCVTTFRVG